MARNRNDVSTPEVTWLSRGQNTKSRGVTKRCRLSWLTNSALVHEPKCRGETTSCGVPANEYSCAQ
jgi:hypothetical protein